MQLYFEPQLRRDTTFFTLDANTSRHLVQVLRMEAGSTIGLTNGKGLSALAGIVDADKRHCRVEVRSFTMHEKPEVTLTVAVSFTKNRSRNEWMLEKLTEIGVSRIVPLVTRRTEKEKFNFERIEAILVAAMLQSQQYFLPAVSEPVELRKIETDGYSQKFVAHCEADMDRQYLHKACQGNKDTLVFIGPEGDFTPEEIRYLEGKDVTAVSLGNRRLRTETAAIYAATIFNAMNDA